MSIIGALLGFGGEDTSGNSNLAPSTVSREIPTPVAFRRHSGSEHTSGSVTGRTPPGSEGTSGSVRGPLRAFHARIDRPQISSPSVRSASPLQTRSHLARYSNDKARAVNATKPISLSAKIAETKSSSALARPHIGQTAPDGRPACTNEKMAPCAALFSAEQLEEIDRRQEVIVRRFFGHHCNLEGSQDAFCTSIDQINGELKLLRLTVSSLSKSYDELKQNSESTLESCLKWCSDRIANENLRSNTHLDSRFQEMVGNMNCLSEALEDRLKAIENDIDSQSQMLISAPHQNKINNFCQLSNTFEQRLREIELGMKNANESFATMNETLSTEIATREIEFQKFDIVRRDVKSALSDIESKLDVFQRNSPSAQQGSPFISECLS